MKPKQLEWWVEHGRDIADRIRCIALQVEHGHEDEHKDEPSVNQQLRDLRAAHTEFAALCRRKRKEATRQRTIAARRQRTKAPRRERPKAAIVDPAAVAVMQEFRRQRGVLTKIAIGIGLTTQAVSQWKVVPLEWVPKVARATGVPRHKLRPDFHQEP